MTECTRICERTVSVVDARKQQLRSTNQAVAFVRAYLKLAGWGFRMAKKPWSIRGSVGTAALSRGQQVLRRLFGATKPQRSAAAKAYLQWRRNPSLTDELSLVSGTGTPSFASETFSFWGETPSFLGKIPSSQLASWEAGSIEGDTPSCSSQDETPSCSSQDEAPSFSSEGETPTGSFSTATGSGPGSVLLSYIHTTSSTLRRELDVEEFQTSDHSIVVADPVPADLLNKPGFHPGAVAHEWVANPEFTGWPEFNQEYWRVMIGTPWALITPTTRTAGWQPPEPLNIAQLALCLEFTKGQYLQQVPCEQWLLIPSQEAQQMHDEGQQRDEALQIVLNKGWWLHKYDVRQAACGDTPLHELEPFLNSVGNPLAQPLQGEQLQLWRQQMELVRSSMLGEGSLQAPTPWPPLPTPPAAGMLSTLKRKLRKLFSTAGSSSADADVVWRHDSINWSPRAEPKNEPKPPKLVYVHTGNTPPAVSCTSMGSKEKELLLAEAEKKRWKRPEEFTATPAAKREPSSPAYTPKSSYSPSDAALDKMYWDMVEQQEQERVRRLMEPSEAWKKEIEQMLLRRQQQR